MNYILRKLKKIILKIGSSSLATVLAILGMAVGPILLCYGAIKGEYRDNGSFEYAECKFDSVNNDSQNGEFSEIYGRTEKLGTDEKNIDPLAYASITTTPETQTTESDEYGCFSLLIPNDGESYTIDAEKYAYNNISKSFVSSEPSQSFTLELEKNTAEYDFFNLRIVDNDDFLISDAQVVPLVDEEVKGKFISTIYDYLVFPFPKASKSEIEITHDYFITVHGFYDPSSKKFTVNSESGASIDKEGTDPNVITIITKYKEN